MWKNSKNSRGTWRRKSREKRWRPARSAAPSPTTETDFEVFGVGPRPLALGAKDPRVFAPAHRGPSTGWQGERWEERPTTPFPRTCSFSRVTRCTCAWALCLLLPVDVPAQVAAPRLIVTPDGRLRNEESLKQGVLVPAYLSTWADIGYLRSAYSPSYPRRTMAKIWMILFGTN